MVLPFLLGADGALSMTRHHEGPGAALGSRAAAYHCGIPPLRNARFNCCAKTAWGHRRAQHHCRPVRVSQKANRRRRGSSPNSCTCAGRRFARAELARKQKEYDASLKQRMMEQAKTSSADTAPQLADLPKVPYLTEQGTISDSGVTSKVCPQCPGRVDEAIP